jgi:tetrahydromethanopterin S-methyltransferase subunit C
VIADVSSSFPVPFLVSAALTFFVGAIIGYLVQLASSML